MGLVENGEMENGIEMWLHWC